MFTGTLIEDLIATVERADANVQDAALKEMEAGLELLLASVNETQQYDHQFLGVA